MRWRVVCGLRDVMLMRAPTSALSSVDLPTEGRPTIATNPQRAAACASGRGSSTIASSVAQRERAQGLRRGRLLAGTPAGATARGGKSQGGDAALDLEALRVRFAVRREHRVLRHCDAARLQPLLQPRLGVLGQRRGSASRRMSSKAASITARAASNPPSRKTAPNTASSASARMERARGRRCAARLRRGAPRRRAPAFAPRAPACPG